MGVADHHLRPQSAALRGRLELDPAGEEVLRILEVMNAIGKLASMQVRRQLTSRHGASTDSLEHAKQSRAAASASGVSGSGLHVERAIGHRMAQIYGTTKQEWEAGRSWQ